ncbi:DUF4082 domain-containing protein [Streptosporangium sp. NBC_01810]|uniref:DUF4082 domain-containing protein n=1 Tax=Streptosporangium sp. NBC_01810 TaxID=2975951 RepID=UPI002DDA4137|nr:DUF4082 domain-containing protein [Streptosporangium sp. NBC_01810]WSA27657.1 DUF4082 domain-containing protein [Streptosporangium sp. NBC_01810]
MPQNPDDAGKAGCRRRSPLTVPIRFRTGVLAAISLLCAAWTPVPGTDAESGTVTGKARESVTAVDTDVRHRGDAAERAKRKIIANASPRSRAHRADCPPTSVICLENNLPGNPSSEWNIPGGGSTDIQGYVTNMSVNKGEIAQFKVNTQSSDYRVDIYRIGYYGGMGARKVTTVQPSVPLPQAQPDCFTQAATGLVDCGTWAVSASWAVPADAVSGVYIANLIREDGVSGASQMIFVVRDDDRGSEILLQTSDATWQAYNRYGNSSLYSSSISPAGRAYKVSYNRPFITRISGCCGGSVESWFFDSEYPMIRWIEANGYDVSYTSNVDTATRGSEILEHKLFVSSGHDEYWSNEMRSNATSARDNGVHLAFFSGNEIFWKTRWENSSDGTSTPYRTLVSYKETLANAKIDPSLQWTGTWRDPRFSPPSDGGRPENAVTGTWFRVNGVSNDAMTVPAEYGKMRLWRNTSIATLPAGQKAVFPNGTLGYEWDVSPENAVEPTGRARLSGTLVNLPSKYLVDYGSTYGVGSATHHLTLYRSASGALVFGAGTTQWAWGLDANHDRAGSPTDIRMQQATVNLLADMGSQPASLQSGLVPATASTDTSPPTSAITSPASGASGTALTTIVIQGTAADTGGGVVADVEVSVDDGTSWLPATGRENWKYRWTPLSSGTFTVAVRAVDDIGNLQEIPTTITVTVDPSCSACTLWPPSTVPATASTADANAVEVGVKFRTTFAGVIRGIRFYKGPANTGTHIGNLWSSSGQLLASATFTDETASGWQQVNFATPITVTADTSYIASYHTVPGGYSITRPYFSLPYAHGPFVAPASAASGGNGVYTYGATSSFPTSTYQSTNYWVDVLFVPARSLWDDQTIPPVASQADNRAIVVGVKFKPLTSGTITGIRFYKGPQNTGTHTGSLWTSGGQSLASATFTNEAASGWQQVNFATPVAVNANTTYIASYHTISGYYSTEASYFAERYQNGPLLALQNGDEGGNGVYTYSATNTFPTSTSEATNYWVDVAFVPSGSLWENKEVPAIPSQADSQPVSVGVKFRAMTSGTIRGIRFYKGSENTGTHVGTLWTSGGQSLASATFTNETASGWQQVNFATPVAVNANTTYVASYHTVSGRYSVTRPYFSTQYTNEPLLALASGAEGGNGVYTYGATSTFPTSTYQSTNYWVDVVFDAD